MTQKLARIFSLGICILLLASLFSWPKPVSAGLSVWSAETIPSRLNNMLGPVGIDVRDFVIANDALTIYAVPGDSIANNVTYKSTDGGVTWTELPVPVRADLVAIAPDDNNLLVIANSSTANVCLSLNGGTTWETLGTVQDPAAGDAAAAIYDIAISPARNGIQYIAVAGKDTTNVANLWYFNYGAATMAWKETKGLTGFATGNETAALAFSPGFSSDATAVVVTDNASAGVVNLQLLKIDSNAWNADASYTGFPCAVANDAGLNNLTSASLALAPTFTGDDPDSRKAFIGLTVNGDTSANATSGIYRFVDTVKTSLLLNTKIHSIAFNGSYLIAGSYDSCTVYRSTNPSSTTPTVNTSYTTKYPGGDNKTVVAWLGSSVMAGTSGDESSFAKSTDTGVTFDDISLIDTAITNATDVAVAKDGSKVYFVTDNGTNSSLWRSTAGSWRRVLSLKGTSNFTVRIEPSSASVIYLVKKGTPTIYYNNAGGAAQWLTRTCNINVQDMAVESSLVAYALDAAGSVSKTVTGGASWVAAAPTTLTSGATIVSVNAGTVLAGSQDGFVAYSTNGSVSWTKISQQVEPVAGNIQVVADGSFATNKIIYAASNTPGQNIMEWTIDTSTAWTDIFNGNLGPGHGIYGLTITNNILYALGYDTVSGQSTLWRLLAPASAPAASTGWTSSTTTITTDTDNATVGLNATPQALKTSTGKLWAVKTNGGNKLYSYSDVIMNVMIAPTQPANSYSVRVNSITGIAYDVTFTWGRPATATKYELLMAYDEDFLIQVATVDVTMNNTIAYVMVGPQQAGAARVDFMPGATYYWKVRVTQPGVSQYSQPRYFTIEPLPDAAAQLWTPGENGMITGTNPAFSWQPLQGATEYQFMLSDNPEMTTPILNTKVETTAIKVNITLEYGKTYFWQVRSTKPIESDWSALVTFTVAEKPTAPTPPPVKVEEAPPVTITITIPATQQTVVSSSTSPAVVTPNYLHVIFITIFVLLGTVIFLIYVRNPKRFFPSVPQTERSLGPSRKYRLPGAQPVGPQAKPEPLAEVLKTPAAPEKTAPRPAPIEKGKEGATVIFAAKSFMWMMTEEKGTGEGQAGLSEQEGQSLGRKLAIKIQSFTRKVNLYIKYPEDAVMLLRIWAQYGSRDQTSSYLTKSFKSRPDNAIRLLKCYLPAAQPEKGQPPIDDFTRAHYDSIAEVVDPDKIYAALTKVFKFKVDTIEEKTPVKPTDRNLAFKFMRLHHQAKSGK